MLSTLHAEHSIGKGVLGYGTTLDARALRLVCAECCEAVAAMRWHDKETRIMAPLAAWRASFPRALAASIVGRVDLVDADFVHLAHMRTLNMDGCTRISDAGLAHLRGIHTLRMRDCHMISDAGLAHLRGIHTLHPHAGHALLHGDHTRRPRTPLRHPLA